MRAYTVMITDADGGNAEGPYEVTLDWCDEEVLEVLPKLGVGEIARFGGGAQPIFEYTRTS
jgi:hypothetical protein